MAKIQKLEHKTGTANDLMGALLAKSTGAPKSLQAGQQITGTIIEIGKKNLIIDIGAKSEGLVVEREFEAAQDYIKTLKPGDKITVTVVVPETVNGQPLLSVRDAAGAQGWKTLEEALKNKSELEAKVVSANRGGLGVVVLGIEGFIPASQLGGKYGKNPEVLHGKTIKAKVVELDAQKDRLVLSEKAVSERELLDQQEKILGTINMGDVFAGKVVGVVNFGAFVQIVKDGVQIEGLVHLSEISWQKVATSQEALEVGQRVKVAVIGKEPGRLALSIKKTEADPWKDLAERYKPETQVKGIVTRINDNGAFVELEGGIEGLIRPGKFPADMSVKIKDNLDVFVEEVDSKAHRISLGVVLKAKPVGYK